MIETLQQRAARMQERRLDSMIDMTIRRFATAGKSCVPAMRLAIAAARPPHIYVNKGVTWN